MKTNLKWISAAILSSVALAGTAYAANYCPTLPTARAEGDRWNIPESAFTKDAAKKALKNLSNRIDNGVRGRDFDIENDLIMVKGRLYLDHLQEYRRESGKEDQELTIAFCRFLKEEAYVRH